MRILSTADVAEAAYLHGGRRASPGGREVYQADGFLGRSAAGPGDAGDRDRHVRVRVCNRAFSHRYRRRCADGAEFVERVVDDAEAFLLGVVRVGDEAALEHIRRACDLGQRAGDEAAGAAFGGGDLQTLRARFGEHGFGELEYFVREHALR